LLYIHRVSQKYFYFYNNFGKCGPIIVSKAQEHQLFLCFVDFRKAFDSIQHEKLWFNMLEMGYPPHVVDLLVKLYHKQQASVKVAGVISNWFRVKKGVQQGWVLSPYLFNILSEMVMRNTRRISRWITDWWSKNIKLKICRRYRIYSYIQTGITSTG